MGPKICKVEENDEAEQIIRAITQGDIGNEVYSQMADDLENAAKIKKQEKTKKKKKKKNTSNSTNNEITTSASESVVESAA